MAVIHWTVVLVFSWTVSKHQTVSTELGNFSCELRYTYVRSIKHNIECSWLQQRYPMCKEGVQVLYSNFPPYNYRKGVTKGILPEMIRLIFDACCLGCTNLTFIGPLDYIGKYSDNRTSIIIPVETSKSSERFFQMDFLYLLEIPGVSFFVSKTMSDAEQMTKDLFDSVLATWPLFVTALLMAVLAGFAVWALDTWFNVTEFPRSFLKGPFEGFWWAFVSMTTVGYGDRAPKSYIARIFAIIWIFLGITIFSMYSASLTTALTTTVSSAKKISISGKRVGFLNSTTAGHSAALKENAVTIPYKTLDEALNDLDKQEIFALALDDNVANFYMKKMKARLSTLRFSYRVKLTSHSYGMVLVDRTTPKGALKHFFKTFFENNEDQREVIVAEAMRGLDRADHTTDVPPSAFSHKSPIFLLTLTSIAGIGVLLVCIGLVIHFVAYRKKKLLKMKEKDESKLDTSTPIYHHEKINLLHGKDVYGLGTKEENGKWTQSNTNWDEMEKEFVQEARDFFKKWKVKLTKKSSFGNDNTEVETGF